MSTKTRFATVGWVALMLGITAAADDAVQTLHADAVTYSAPKAWKAERPSSPMRKAQLKIEAAEGDTDPAEMTVVVLGSLGGGVEKNVTRWESQFAGGNGQPAKAKVEKKMGKNVEVTRVEITGKYAGMGMPGQPKQEGKTNYRLLGAILMTPDNTGYFFKLTGPDKTVAATAKDFDAMIASMTLEQ